MNTAGTLFTCFASFLQLVLPRRFALLPLLLTFVWMTDGQVFDLNGLNFTALRVVVGFGVLRVWTRGEHTANGSNSADVWMLVWAAWLLMVAPFHAAGAFVFRLGMVWDCLGSYYLVRVFLRTPEDVIAAFRVLCIALVPVAISMVIEKFTDRNAFGALGGVDELSAVREGNIRATGPFAHPILAGTVGAALIPMALAIRKLHPFSALLGLASGCAMIFACTSSGPILMEAFIMLGLFLHRFRRHMNAVRWGAVFVILGLAAVMHDPVYFLMAKIDLAGGSTGWFRAELIRSSIEHLDEWWAIGTDFTRHWMPTGNPANEGQTDITDYYLQMGVWGGLALIFCLLMILRAGFLEVRRALADETHLSARDRYLAWILGATLFGHAMNFLTVSLFDKTKIGLFLLLAGVAAIRRSPAPVTATMATDASRPCPDPVPLFS
jgi:hypothetical protein